VFEVNVRTFLAGSTVKARIGHWTATEGLAGLSIFEMTSLGHSEDTST
jgi:hypothetical protein